ncbi:MAG TPA: mycothiol synthase [Jatrophihabitans sp.]|nr:mycothiol synthase [Jatrophihabitans sp.]
MSLQRAVLTPAERLEPAELAAVRALVRAAPGGADQPPISEQGMLGLAGPGRHLLALADGEVTGYAQLTDGAEPTVELVAAGVEPATELLAGLPPRYRLWAHGERSVAHLAAVRAGLRPVRTLLQLRATPGAIAAPALPDGVVIRPFEPGADDGAWLAVNARAFAHHPEQGGWTQHDLDQRLAAAWFDPAGFLLAWRGGELLGYHWTKVHAEFDPPLGEVYVLGVDPAAQGLRLGSALLAAGLRHLTGRGLGTVLLYVEQDNATAVHLYEKAGFGRYAVDIQYAAG